MPQELLEVADVARQLDLTPATVRLHANTGRLPVAVTTPRGQRLFRPADVEKFGRARERMRMKEEAGRGSKQ
jgi:DNA-binding transcriptional MerR regulator